MWRASRGGSSNSSGGLRQRTKACTIVSDAAHDGEQDLPAGDCGPEPSSRSGFPTEGGGPVQVSGDHHRQRGGGVLYAGATGVAAGVCGQARVRRACCFLVGDSRWAMAGGAASSVADLFPTIVSNDKGTFKRENATVQLTAAGAESPITRDPGPIAAANVERWRKLPYLNDYQDPGTPEARRDRFGADDGGACTMPLLVTQSYGHGKTAVLATSGTWRWQMEFAAG